MADEAFFLPLDPQLEEQLNDIDEYIRAQYCESDTEPYLPLPDTQRNSPSHIDFSSDRKVPDESMTWEFEGKILMYFLVVVKFLVTVWYFFSVTIYDA